MYKSGCHARVHTSYNLDTIVVLYRSGVHNHCSSVSKVDAQKTINVMKEKVYSSGTSSTREILSTTIQHTNGEARHQLQSLDSLSRTIRKWRQVNTGAPAILTSRTGFEIPEDYKILPEGASFLAYDSGSDDENRIIIFATESGLDDLERSNVWASDGTFKSSPNMWFQFFTIHTIIGQCCWTYSRLFSIMKEIRPKCLPNLCLSMRCMPHTQTFSRNLR